MSDEMDGAVVRILLQISEDVEYLRSISRHHYVSEEYSSENLHCCSIILPCVMRGLEQVELAHSLRVS